MSYIGKVREEARQFEKLTNEGPIKSLTAFVSFPSTLNRDGSGVFRGEPEFYDVPLNPSVFRELFKDGEDLMAREIGEIKKARSIYQSKKISDKYLNAFAPHMHDDDLNWLFFARHVGRDTRLLDVSWNPLVALYFACGGVPENDGVVYFFFGRNFRPVKKGYSDWLDRRDFPILPISFKEFLSSEFDQRDENTPYLVAPDLPQERILAQNGAFFLWKDPEMRPAAEKQLIPAVIDGDSKHEIRSDLAAFGISKQSLFPNEKPAKSGA